MRTSSTITTAEQAAYAAFCQQHDIKFDDSAAAVANAQFIGRYFLDTWKEDITPENLAQAFEALKPHLTFVKYEPYQKELNALFASLSPTEQEAFANWKGVSGLKATAKAAYIIIAWIKDHGWQITNERLDLAAGQRNVAPFLQYEHRSTFKSKHTKVDDGKPTGFISRSEANLPYSDRMHHSLSQEDQPSVQKQLEAAEAEFKKEAYNLTRTFNNHAWEAYLKQILDQGVKDGLNWEQIVTRVKAQVQVYNRQKQRNNRSIR